MKLSNTAIKERLIVKLEKKTEMCLMRRHEFKFCFHFLLFQLVSRTKSNNLQND